MDDLTGTRTVAEYFHEVVTSALRSHQVPLAEMTEFYVVNLLADYVHTPEATSTLPGDEPLALKLCQAAQTPTPDERLRLLKDVGDESLYVSGFFGESLQRRLVDVDYYISMGGTAYGEASRLVRLSPRGDRFGEVFAELAEKFARLVDVLTDVSDASAMSTQQGILRAYERWMRTRSEFLERRLRAKGFLTGDGGGFVQ